MMKTSCCALIVSLGCAGSTTLAPTTTAKSTPAIAAVEPTPSGESTKHSEGASPPAPKAFLSCQGAYATLDFAAFETGQRQVHLFSCAGICTPSEGVLTDQGAAEVAATHAKLVAEKLLPSYGCPACADGPMTRFRIVQNGASSTVLHDPRHADQSPSVLREADGLREQLCSAVQRCQSSELVTMSAGCVPSERP